MKLGFACAWDPNKGEATWSYTPISLLRALLRMQELEITDINVGMAGLLLKAAKLMYVTYHPNLHRFASGYIYSPLHAWYTQRKLLEAEQQSPSMDAIISMGDYGYSATPQYPYFDVTMPEYLYINQNPVLGKYESVLYSSKTLNRWAERQHKIFATLPGVFSMSHHAAREAARLMNLPPEKIHVVHAGINAEYSYAPQPRPIQEKFILFVGRDFMRKGGDIVVEAFRSIQQKHNVTLVIAGPHKLPDGLQLPERVIYIGNKPRAELNQYFQHAELFVMPSRYEAYGIVFGEALCNGVPVIARNAFAMPEFITHGVNGYLMEADSESPDELATLISMALENTEMKSYVQQHVPDYRAYYSWDRVAHDMISVIKRNLAAKQ
ncbi:MAG: glycosyltransferase family 4 protein [Bacteriodetes bacterium]|nr:glycosyltransferase family 4 protein [Bacteroidota bacterium]